MHELAITRHIVAVVTERAAGRPVRSVRLRIGDLSGVQADAVAFCFEACAAGTCAEGAVLHVERVEGRARCAGCGEVVRMEAPLAICPCDRHAPVTIIAGEDLVIERAELGPLPEET